MFHIFAQNIDCGYTIEPPHRGGSNEYPQSMFWSKNNKMGIPLHILVFLYKSGVQGGMHCTDMLSFIYETSHVLLAGVSGGFSPGTPVFAPPTD